MHVRHRHDPNPGIIHPTLFQSPTSHNQSLPRSERIVDVVTILSAANDDYQLINIFQDVPYCIKMAQMERLKPSDVKSTLAH
jgi:hypothetical protein